ncbi:hypothetical protein G4H71_04740 [Rhodococcus triatomae]|uniref:hypothetical protein n=1 Tax=Rhodococcus triatomae TaxID=300028 RepID=UPI0009342933|nr:hypothetical protein [Rhodococcus triatomae]QNG17903.1 hypothetical protein G4H72_03305 [Rhodococcus triatomae]QNG22429.1 hypothetical protein G4H71_04740 [Rhodococcus triatomae]
MIDAHTLPGSTDIDTIRNIRRWTPGACVWCGNDDSVEMYRNEPRCATCRTHEEVIDEARKFLGMYGLRPLGGTLQSEDDEEYEHRLGARDARRALNEIRLTELPDPAAVRKALRPRAAGVVEHRDSGVSAGAGVAAPTPPPAAATSRPKAARPSTPAPSPVRTDAVDVAALEARVTGLLDQMGAIDAQIALVGDASGLAAKARLKNLENQKATILRTLAALEKARIAASR